MTDALTRLADAVEAGTAIPDYFLAALHRSTFHGMSAYDGSLDAAKALHDAALPGWDWSVDNIGRSQFCAYVYDDEKTISAFNSNLARAWLLAILRALAQVQG